MPYQHTSRGQLKAQLASRLGDTSNVYWIDDELNRIINESLRTWGVLSGFWRERGTLSTVANTAFYDLPTSLTSGLLNYTVTDRDIIKTLQYHLLESVSSQSSWLGTEMFTLDDLTRAVERRCNQFLQDTGIIITRTTSAIPPSPVGRVDLTDNVIDVRRVAWIDTSSRYYQLWRDDEFSQTAYDPNWAVNPSTPIAYSVMATQPVQIQLSPVPVVSATLELLAVQSQATLSPSSAATTLTMFDDLTPFVKWGALADLLGIDGVARDPERAAFCEKRYQQGVQLTRMLACVVQSQINGVPVQPSTVYDLDAGYSNWQNKTGKPKDIGIAAWNLICARPIPDDVYALTFDVVRKAPIPAADNSFIQLGREQLDMILDYAEHLALFKVGGAEFAATQRQADNFMLQAVTYNQRLSAAARYVIAPKEYSRDDTLDRPRRKAANALGAAPSLETANA